MPLTAGTALQPLQYILCTYAIIKNSKEHFQDIFYELENNIQRLEEIKNLEY